MLQQINTPLNNSESKSFKKFILSFKIIIIKVLNLLIRTSLNRGPKKEPQVEIFKGHKQWFELYVFIYLFIFLFVALYIHKDDLQSYHLKLVHFMYFNHDTN